jgi:hypothetical protein
VAAGYCRAKDGVDDCDNASSFSADAPPRRSTSSLGESAMHAEMWEPIEGICEPCDHIAFAYIPLQAAEICMTFAATRGGPRELILRFKQVVVLSGEDEAPGGFVPAPAINSLPKLGRGARPTWTFPPLRIVDSEPLKNYQLMRRQKNRAFLHGIDGQSGACYCKRGGGRSLEHLNLPGCLCLTIGSTRE